MSFVYTVNWGNFTLELSAPKGSDVWVWYDGATGHKLRKTRHKDGVYQVWVGGYRITPEGRIWARENDVYYNGCSNPEFDAWKRWGIPKHFLEKAWVNGRQVSLPYEHQDKRFVMPIPIKLYQKRIRELEKVRGEYDYINS